MQKPSCFLTLIYFFDGKSRLQYYDQTVNTVKKMKEHQKTRRKSQKSFFLQFWWNRRFWVGLRQTITSAEESSSFGLAIRQTFLTLFHTLAWCPMSKTRMFLYVLIHFSSIVTFFPLNISMLNGKNRNNGRKINQIIQKHSCFLHLTSSKCVK